MSSTSLSQIRDSLAALESFSLPERYHRSIPTDKDTAVLPADLTQRYRQARATYLRHRLNDLILDHLSTLESQKDTQGNLTLTLQIPSEHEQDPEQLQQLLSSVKQDLYQNVMNVKMTHESVCYKYKTLMDKNARLKEIVDQLEREKSYSNFNGTVDHVEFNHASGSVESSLNDNVMEESELQLQEERLQSLLAKKSVLEGKLRQIRNETELVKHDIHVKKDRLVQILQMNRDKEGDSRPISPDTVFQDIHLEDVQTETQKLGEETAKYQDMSLFYESARLALEEISGIKILSIAEKEADTTTERSHIVIKLLLLHEHTMEMHLSCTEKENHRRSNTASTGEEFKISSAHLTSNPILTDTLTNLDEIKVNPTPTVALAVPPLDDLVSIARNFDSARGIRFVLHETLKRIRITSDRVTELAHLRSKYLTKITLPSKQKYSFGGEEQEVICSINSSITVVIRLTPDCPRIQGSAYIHQIVGVGGWDDQLLLQMKDKVNAYNSRSPVQVMDFLVKEVDVLEKQGVRIPTTPVLPARYQ